MAAITQTIPKSPALDKTRRRIERWRATRLHPNVRMPTALWDAAVAAARRHGLYPTAQGLRVDYGALKKHLDAADSDQARAATAFVELVPERPMTPADPVGCVVERTGPAGSTRMRVTGLAPSELMTLARMAWSEAQ